MTALESRFESLQEHTDSSLKGSKTIVLEARLDQVNVKYAELAASMADLASKLKDNRQVRSRFHERINDWILACWLWLDHLRCHDRGPWLRLDQL